jgi:hypothetical protein
LALANLKIFSNDGQGVGNKSINPPELVQTTTFIGFFFFYFSAAQGKFAEKFQFIVQAFFKFSIKKSWFYLITSYQITFVIDVLFFYT